MKPHKISTHSDNCYFHFFYRLSDWVEILWGFTKFFFKQMLKISAVYLVKQKSFVYRSNFQWRFWYMPGTYYNNAAGLGFLLHRNIIMMQFFVGKARRYYKGACLTCLACLLVCLLCNCTDSSGAHFYLTHSMIKLKVRQSRNVSFNPTGDDSSKNERMNSNEFVFFA